MLTVRSVCQLFHLFRPSSKLWFVSRLLAGRAEAPSKPTLLLVYIFPAWLLVAVYTVEAAPVSSMALVVRPKLSKL